MMGSWFRLLSFIGEATGLLHWVPSMAVTLFSFWEVWVNQRFGELDYGAEWATPWVWVASCSDYSSDLWGPG